MPFDVGVACGVCGVWRVACGADKNQAKIDNVKGSAVTASVIQQSSAVQYSAVQCSTVLG